MNKSQTLLEINTAIASMLDSNWSYFSAPSYMKWFIANSIISMPLIRRPACDPIYTCLFVPHVYMRVCKKMVIYLEIKTAQSRRERRYTWQTNARISCHNFETNDRPINFAPATFPGWIQEHNLMGNNYFVRQCLCLTIFIFMHSLSLSLIGQCRN